MSDIAVRREGADIIEAVITKGDLAKLTPVERTQYYNGVCRSVGLNPFTRPFEFITLSGKLTLYARREATDQLRKLNGISLEVISREVVSDILTVHVRARDKTGRTDEDFGSVTIAGLKGEALANATMKAITKAKRRCTLSISGLGFLDESEVEDISHRAPPPAPVSTRAELDQFASSAAAPAEIVDPETGEILDSEQIHAQARAAAERGTELLRAHWRNLSDAERDMLRDAVGTPEAPGALLIAAQQADAAAQAERQRTPESLAGDPPDLQKPLTAPAVEPARDNTPEERPSLKIDPPLKSGKPDYKTWAVALFRPKVRQQMEGTTLAYLMGDNETYLNACRSGGLSSGDLADLEDDIREAWERCRA